MKSMDIKKYFWELNPVALKTTKKILSNSQHKKFVEKMFVLLSRCDKPKELFSIIDKKTLITKWPEIKKFWLRRNVAKDFMLWWDTIYERLARKNRDTVRTKIPFEKIGEIIKNGRLHKGMTQTQLSLLTGIPQPDISLIELGKKNITLEKLLKICKILGIKNISLEF